MAKQSLRSGGTISASEVKVVNDSQRLKGLLRESTRDLMSLRKIAISALNGRGSALILRHHSVTPVPPAQLLSVIHGRS
jgi:hypothetical protein